nr:MAG TPA: hypothetical protein [Caudoviricetes sp.]
MNRLPTWLRPAQGYLNYPALRARSCCRGRWRWCICITTAPPGMTA